MTKFGLFDGGGAAPIQEYEGDFMKQADEHVFIMKNIGDMLRQVGAIKLAPGQSVKQIED